MKKQKKYLSQSKVSWSFHPTIYINKHKQGDLLLPLKKSLYIKLLNYLYQRLILNPPINIQYSGRPFLNNSWLTYLVWYDRRFLYTFLYNFFFWYRTEGLEFSLFHVCTRKLFAMTDVKCGTFRDFPSSCRLFRVKSCSSIFSLIVHWRTVRVSVLIVTF